LDPFDVLAGVKQGCVLASVIFNLFLVAVTLVFQNGFPPNAGIPVNFRLDGNLFSIRRLQAKTKISSVTIFDLQYADDAAIPSHTAAGFQHSLDILAATYQRAGLIVNTKKTEVLPQSVNSATHPTFTIHGDALNEVHQFTYLGSTLTSDCNLDNEVQQRIKLASAAFGRLSHRVFLNHNLNSNDQSRSLQSHLHLYPPLWLRDMDPISSSHKGSGGLPRALSQKHPWHPVVA